MESSDIQLLYDDYHRRLDSIDLSFKRYLYGSINWDARLIGIKGPRGVGKTTMLLQRIKEAIPNVDDAFYISLDNYWLLNNSITELVNYLYSHGATHIFFDEVHKFKNWSSLLKTLYDSYPDLKIVYTGSSLLEIDNSKTDLSRRQTLYTLRGLSFREYLEYEDIAKLKAVSLEEILKDHVRIAMQFGKGIKVLKYFDDYIDHGFYPFYKDAGRDYPARLAEVTNLVMESDLPAVENVEYSTVEKAKKLLATIAGNVPLQPNISKLCAELGTTRDLCLKLLYSLDKAGILNILTKQSKSYKHLQGPEKIYLDNTNLMSALCGRPNVGTARETFFANQVSVGHDLTIPVTSKKDLSADFLVDGKYTFEIGGTGKTFDQIADLPDSYLALDGIVTGNGNRIPLWLFGMMY
jgi:predicted AAA+ superfamily ATPase